MFLFTANVKYKLEGEVELKGQYSMTMEPQTCVVIPKEDSLIIHPATQWPQACQQAVAIALNIPQNRCFYIGQFSHQYIFF